MQLAPYLVTKPAPNLVTSPVASIATKLVTHLVTSPVASIAANLVASLVTLPLFVSPPMALSHPGWPQSSPGALALACLAARDPGRAVGDWRRTSYLATALRAEARLRGRARREEPRERALACQGTLAGRPQNLPSGAPPPTRDPE